MATTVAQAATNEKLLTELQEMARDGANCDQLVQRIRESLQLPAENMVPVLAYLCRAFSIPLSLALPLREDEGNGAYGRAITIPIWFTSLVTGKLASNRWSWDEFYEEFTDPLDFDALEWIPMEHLASKTKASIRRIAKPEFPWYLEGVFETYIRKSYSSDSGLFGEVQHFANAYSQERDKCKIVAPLRTKIEFKIEDRGPIYWVACMVQAFRKRES